MVVADSLPSPSLIKTKESESGSFPMGVSLSPLVDSPSSVKRIWSALRRRADGFVQEGSRGTSEVHDGDRSKRLKEDTMLLLRGFDSAACTLSHLSENIENALQGARELAKPPTLTEIFHSREPREQKEEEEKKRPLKRKFESASSSCSDDQGGKSGYLEDNLKSPVDEKLKKLKNLAATMATKASSFAKELRSLRSDLSFLQERCALLEEENKRLKEGFTKGIRPEEDDLVMLQLETLLAEKSRLANENANLVRENQCLNQLVAYHQLTTQDLTESYEQAIRSMCLGFTSPIAEAEAEDGNLGDESVRQQDLTESYEQAIRSMCLGFTSPIAEAEAEDGNLGDESVRQSLIRHIDFSNPLDGYFQQEQL